MYGMSRLQIPWIWGDVRINKHKSCNKPERAADVKCHLSPCWITSFRWRTLKFGFGITVASSIRAMNCMHLCSYFLFFSPLRLAQSRTNPYVLDTGLTAQDIQSTEMLSSVDWNKIDSNTGEKDDLFMFWSQIHLTADKRITTKSLWTKSCSSRCCIQGILLRGLHQVRWSYSTA